MTKRAITLFGLLALACAGLWLDPGGVNISGDDIEPVRYERPARSTQAFPSSASGTWVTTATTATGPVCITMPTGATAAASSYTLTAMR